MPDPVLLRHPFTLGRWFAYLPCDHQGRWWWLVDMGFPAGDDADKPGFSILGMMYGRARPGKLFQAYGGGDWTESGSWYDSSGTGTSDGDWMYRSCAVANAYVDLAIPSGHNEIGVLLYDVVGSGNLLFSWDDGTTDGLDVTQYTSSATKVQWITVATGAQPDGIIKLRIKKENDTKVVRIIGVQSWDTGGEGDPAAVSGGKAVGHGIPHRWNTSDVVANLPPLEPASDAETVQFGYAELGKSYEFAVRWDKAQATNTFRWTGGGSHMDKSYADNAVYTPSGTDGPSIRVDGVGKGNVYAVYDDTDAPIKCLLTGSTITLRSSGFADHDRSGTQNESDPDVEWSYTLTASGLAVAVALRWTGTVDLADGQYSLMLPLNEHILQDGDHFTALPSETRYGVYNLADDIHAPAGNSCDINLKAMPNAVIRMDSTAPMREIYYVADTNKLYMRVEPADIAGGLSPSAGDMLLLGGRYEVRRKRTNSRDTVSVGSAQSGAFIY